MVTDNQIIGRFHLRRVYALLWHTNKRNARIYIAGTMSHRSGSAIAHGVRVHTDASRLSRYEATV